MFKTRIKQISKIDNNYLYFIKDWCIDYTVYTDFIH